MDTFLSNYAGKSQKKKLNNVPENGIDIAAAIKSRKPLRKTSSNIKLEGKENVLSIPNEAQAVHSLRCEQECMCVDREYAC